MSEEAEMPSTRRRRLLIVTGVAVAAVAAGLAIVATLVSSTAARTSVGYVQAASGSASGERLSVGFRAHVRAGDLLVGQFRTEGSASVSDSVNGPWSEAVQTVAGHVTHSLWYRQDASAGRTTVTVAGEQHGGLRAILAEYSGLVASDALDRGSCKQGDSPTVTTGVTAPVVGGELLFVGFDAFEHPIAIEAGSSGGADATLRGHLSAADGTSAEEDVVSTVPGVQDASFQLRGPAPGGWAACAAAFRRLLAPQVSWLPVVGGDARRGGTLRTTNGSWDNAPARFAYSWRRCDADGRGCETVADASASSYELRPADVAHTLRAVVTAANAGGTGSVAISNATAVIAP